MNEINNFYNSLKIQNRDVEKFFSTKQNRHSLTAFFHEKIQRLLHFFQHRIWINKKRVVAELKLHKVQDPAILNDFAKTRIYRKVLRTIHGYDLEMSSTKDKATEAVLFFKRFLKDHKNIGSLMPSSKKLAKKIVKCIPKGSQDSQEINILEVGAGTGAFTDKIIKRMGDNYRLTVIEFDPTLVEVLNKKYESLKGRVNVIQANIIEYCPDKKYDYIISGLPLNAFKSEFVKAVFEKFDNLIKEEGKIAYFEYILISRIKMLFLSAEDKQNLKKIFKIKEDYYKKNASETMRVPLNLTPASVKVHQVHKK